MTLAFTAGTVKELREAVGVVGAVAAERVKANNDAVLDAAATFEQRQSQVYTNAVAQLRQEFNLTAPGRPATRRILMPTIPPGRYTRQRIRDLALNRAGNRALDADATDFLAQHLFELYTLADWPFLYVSAPLSITGQTVDLPADFVSVADDHGLQILAIDGQPTPDTFVAEVAPELLAARSGPGMGSGPPPQYYAISRSAESGEFRARPVGPRARRAVPVQAPAGRAAPGRRARRRSRVPVPQLPRAGRLRLRPGTRTRRAGAAGGGESRHALVDDSPRAGAAALAALRHPA